MSNYNATLQSNNVDLQAVLQALQNKAAGGSGVSLPELTNEGSASDLLSGKQLIDGDGNVVTGTITTKTASNLTVSGATVTVPAGYYATQTTKSVATATQATPSISVNSSGLITASATQTAGYVTAGTKSATKQLTTQAAQTITPGTTDKTIASGRYLTGTQTIKGDANLIPANIISGKSIFGVSGTATAGGGTGETVVDDVSKAIIEGTITDLSNDKIDNIRAFAFYTLSTLTTVSFPACTSIGISAFQSCYSLTTASFPACSIINSGAFATCSRLATVSFPACTSIGSFVFRSCYSLTTASFPACTSMSNYAFAYCSRLATVSFPACTYIGSYGFQSCHSLATVSFPACSIINYGAFSYCSSLTTFVLAGSSVPTLRNSNAFANTLMSTTGYFYVPSSLIASYQAATNWTYFSSRFSAVEDYAGWDGVYGSG